MEVVVKGRGDGKTERAIEIAKETGAYLIVHDHSEALRIGRENPEIRFPVTYNEFLSGGMRASYVRNFVIDNADMFIQYVARAHGAETIEAITITGDVKED